MSDYVPSIFESFNARSLAPDQVAKTFIPPKHFDELIKRNHSIVIGPRGSGKTTLLKMLHTSALKAWNHPKSEEIRGKIDFTGVFIPADVTWGAQIEALGKGKLEDNILEIFKTSAFTTHILTSFVDAIRDRIDDNHTIKFRSITLDKVKESEIVKQLAFVWGIDIPLPTLLNLRLSLKKRLIEISEMIKIESISDAENRIDRLKSIKYIFQDFLPLISSGIDVVNSAIDQKYGKWALLFDELEIAPRNIRQSLLAALRSTDDRILFKLSLSPYNEDSNVLEEAFSAMPGQDYNVIKLWYPKREDCISFCVALLTKMLEEHGTTVVDPEKVFGTSPFDIKNNEGYKVGSTKHKSFKLLAEIDPSFKQYLINNKIDIDHIDDMDDHLRASIIRKVTTLVTLRLEYRREAEDADAKLRSRKNPRLYTGATSLFTLVEGNPRWTIGIMSNLIDDYMVNRSVVNRAKQSTEIFKSITRYRAMLKTISVPNTSRFANRGLLSIIDKIGDFFSKKVIIDDFTPEPPFSFTVDSHVDPNLYEAIGKALNAGAIFHIPDSEGEGILGSLKGKRFRISYLLAPHYKLPITLGRPVSLMSILSKIESDEIQGSIFGDNYENQNK